MVERKDICTTSVHSSDPNENTLLLFSDPNYQQPTPNDVRAVIKKMGISGSEVAARVGVSSDTVRKWQASPESSGFKPIPYAPWRLLLIDAGLVDPPGR
jgi:hypothetical protein